MIKVDDLIGVPFVGKGRDKHGFDCYGLAKEVFRRYGCEIPEYYAEWDNNDACTEFAHKSMNGGLWRRLEEPKEPCLMAIRFGVKRGIVNHSGVYIGNGMFIHTRERTGVCIEKINSPAWRGLIEGYYEYIGNCKEPV